MLKRCYTGEKMLKELVVSDAASIQDAMEVIDGNARGICFVVSEGNRLVGSVTDGDIRRALIEGVDKSESVERITNVKCVSLPQNSEEQQIRKLFGSNLKLIPLLDEYGAIVDVADAKTNHLIPVLEPCLQGKELEYLTDCINTTWISSKGKYLTLFEEQFSALCDGYHALAVSNGTSALHLACMALGIGPGDEVIVPNLTFAASANAVLYCGAKPVLCEVREDTLCLDVDSAKALITSKTKAILLVHLYGQLCDVNKLNDLAKANKLYLIEDCAEALGSRMDGKHVGTFGDAATFSFFGNKTISTGEGGMVVFKEVGMYENARVLRDHGMNPKKRYWHDLVGYNYRMTNLQAAVGVAQMERLGEIVNSKVFVASIYIDALSFYPELFTLPKNIAGAENSHWLFIVRIKVEVDMEIVMSELLMQGIETRPVFYPLHEMPPYSDCASSQDFSVSTELSRSGICLPSSAGLEEEKIRYICARLVEIVKAAKRYV